MAIARTLKEHSYGGNWSAAFGSRPTSFSATAFTPTANSLLLFAVGAVGVGVNLNQTGTDCLVNASVTGGGLTWTYVTGIGATGAMAQSGVWVAQVGASPSSTTITLTTEVTSPNRKAFGSWSFAVWEITGHNTGTPTGGKIAATWGNGSAGSADGAQSMTLDAAPASSDYVFALMHGDGDTNAAGGATPGSTFTEVGEVSSTALAVAAWGEIEERTGSTSTTADWQDIQSGSMTSYSAAGVAVVIKADASTPSGTVAVTLSAATSTASGSVSPAGTATPTLAAATSSAVGFANTATALVAGVAGEAGTSLGSNNAVSLPSGAASGDLVVVFVGNDNTSTTAITASTGWTGLNAQTQGANVHKGQIFARLLDGGANDSLSVSGATQDYAVSVVLFKADYHSVSDVSTGIPNAGAVSSTTGNADPPSLTLPAARQWTFLACGIIDATTGNTISGVPANYTQIDNRTSASSTSSTVLAVARYYANSSGPENPGTFTNSARNWIAYTVAVPGALFTGTSAQTLAAFTSTASGSQSSGNTGTATPTLAAASSSASGSVANPVTGTSAQTLAAFTSSASGLVQVNITGTSAQTLAAFTSTASGSVANPVTGTSAQTLAAFTSSASGILRISGSGSVTLGNVTTTATGVSATGVVGSVSATLTAFTATATGVVSIGLFPTTVSSSARYLQDHTGEPWPLIGDAAWSAIVSLTISEQAAYLDRLQALGYNAALVELIENEFSHNPPQNTDGVGPYAGTMFQSATVEAYWARVDGFIGMAAARGITVLACPAYIGYNDAEGVAAEMAAASDAQMQAYGNFIGQRYRGYLNIIWVMGCDRDAPSATLLSRTDHIVTGLKAADDTHLITAHAGRGQTADAVYGAYSWLAVNTSYTPSASTFGNTVSDNAAAYSDTPTRPFFNIEGWYENEHSATRAQLRYQAWAALGTGGIGHVFGNAPRWYFNDWSGGVVSPTWRQTLGLDTPGTNGDASINFGQIFGGIFSTVAGWESMAPDTTDVFLVAGEQTGASQAVARFSTTGALVYMPTSRAVHLDLRRITSFTNATVTRYDPTNGATANIGTFATSVILTVDVGALPTNAGGDTDWLLIVQGVNSPTGTAAVQLASATMAAAGTVTIQATGTVAVTLAATTSTASGAVRTIGTATVTLANATSSASGAVTVAGASAQTLTNATSSASGVLGIVGTGATTLADATTVLASGIMAPAGTVSVTLAAATSSASGSVTLTGVAGNAAVTLANATSSASGLSLAPASGTVAVTLATVTVSASGAVINPTSGAVATTLAAVTVTASGLVTANVVGTAAPALADATTTTLGVVGAMATVLIARRYVLDNRRRYVIDNRRTYRRT